ncbi:MAG: glycosyltransferase family 2 protein [Candidatus Cloacimonetes bacterium]|nr:glycosyltransferase family 2 protein [Candidatus Cloacimonadota bacterium]
MAEITIGIVTYNRLELTKRCLESLWSKTDMPFYLIIADNCSSDGTQDYLKSQYVSGKIDRLILLDKNYGVATASNVIWELVQTSYYLKLDNDIEVLKENWLSEMVDICKQNNNQLFIAYSFLKQLYNISYPTGILPSGHQVQIPEANMGGACMLIHRSIQEQLGFWCEDYSPYGEEDTDYCLRARLAEIPFFYMHETDRLKHLYCHASESHDSTAYRDFKNTQRTIHTRENGLFYNNLLMYQYELRSLKMKKKFTSCFKNEYECELQLNREYSHEFSLAVKKLELIKNKIPAERMPL